MPANNDLVDRLRAGLGKFGGRLAVLLIGAGIVAILLGWNGAASDIAVAGQVPYLLSGLGVGLALVGTGSALMIVQAHREDRARLEAKLDVLIDAVTRSGGVVPPALGTPSFVRPAAAPAVSNVSVSAPAPAASTTSTSPLAPAVPSNLSGLVVAGSASYHVPGCKLVDGREEVAYLTPDEARSRWLSPCRVCQPEAAGVSR